MGRHERMIPVDSGLDPSTYRLWGLTPLQDQQLGGAVMWAPGGLAFLAVALIIARHWLGGASPRTVPAQ